MQTAMKKLEDGTIELTITIPWEKVKKTWDEVVEELTKNATIPGFRKGKAPKNIVEEQLNEEKIREEVLKKLLPQTYIEAIQEHKLHPIINPKIHVEKLEEGKDWVFSAITCETPEIDLDNYKDAVQKITAKSKIVIPGKVNPFQGTPFGPNQSKPLNPAQSKPFGKTQGTPFDAAQGKQEVKFDDIVKTVLENVSMQIPNILLDAEVDRLLAQTLDEIKRLGLSLEQYLSSTKRTAEDLRNEYKIKAINDIKFEFVLQKIAEVEKIAVEPKEIDEAIEKAKDENERKNLETNRYLLASILRQQKTLDFLKNL